MNQKTLFRQRTKLSKQKTFKQKKSSGNVRIQDSVKRKYSKNDKVSSTGVSQKQSTVNIDESEQDIVELKNQTNLDKDLQNQSINHDYLNQHSD